MTYRILVTGSRTWTDFAQIRDALHFAFLQGCQIMGDRHELGIPTLVIGDAPNGADRIASDVWLANVGSDHIERHPARWDIYTRSAGAMRNAEMVSTAPDICLAFLDWCQAPTCLQRGTHRSHGTTHCSELAEMAGIEVRRFYP